MQIGRCLLYFLVALFQVITTALILCASSDPDHSVVTNKKKAIVAIYNPDGSRGTGSFLLYKGRYVVITNAHVCGHNILGYTKVGPPESAKHATPMRVINSNTPLDLCALQPENEPDSYLEIGEEPSYGDPAIAYGVPFDTGLTPSPGRILDAVDLPVYITPMRLIVFHDIRTSITTFPGNSGSPILNRRGSVIGIMHAADPRTFYGYAIPLSHLIAFLEALR